MTPSTEIYSFTYLRMLSMKVLNIACGIFTVRTSAYKLSRLDADSVLYNWRSVMSMGGKPEVTVRLVSPLSSRRLFTMAPAA